MKNNELIERRGLRCFVRKLCCGRTDIITLKTFKADRPCFRCANGSMTPAPWSKVVAKTGKMVENGEPKLG
jgi:hypothetical protein